MAKTVIGLMDNLGEAQAVVRDLVDSGIEREDIGFMANEKHAFLDSAAPGESDGSRLASLGALTGAGTGAAIGGLAGLALSLAPLAIPGIGPLLAAGPIVAALTGAGLGAVGGGLLGGLRRLGVPAEQAHYYAEGVRRGGILVTVATESDAQAQRAVHLMKRQGAVDIDQRATEWKRQGWKGRFEAVDHGDVSSQERPANESSFQEELMEMETAMRTSNASAYTGPERRVRGRPWKGIERRRAA